jgi:putative MATE family efflux protein
LVDVFLVGRYAPVSGNGDATHVSREAALAAIHVSSLLNFLPMLLANGISVATIATISRAVGAKDGSKVADGANRSLATSIAIGAVIGVLAGATARFQIDALRVPQEAYETSVRCLQILSYGSVTMFALLQVTAVERAIGRSVPPVIVLTAANIANAVAAFYAIPRFGAVGAAWATVVSRGIFALFGLAWLYARSADLRTRFGPLAAVIAEGRELLRIGFPASLQIFSRALSVLLITRMLPETVCDRTSTEATDMAAAYSVALRLEMIAMFACAGWGSAAAAAVGQNLGAGNVDRALRMGWAAAGIAAVPMIGLGALFYWFAPQLFPVVLLDDTMTHRIDAIVGYGTEYFRIVAFAYAAVGIGIVLAESANGAGATRISFAIDFIAYVAVLFVLAFYLRSHLGRQGLWYALLAVHVAVALTYMALFNRVIRSRARVAS